MSIITGLTRMWLTRSVRPFTFTKEYDECLPYAECDKMGLYIFRFAKVFATFVRTVRSNIQKNCVRLMCRHC